MRVTHCVDGVFHLRHQAPPPLQRRVSLLRKRGGPTSLHRRQARSLAIKTCTRYQRVIYGVDTMGLYHRNTSGARCVRPSKARDLGHRHFRLRKDMRSIFRAEDELRVDNVAQMRRNPHIALGGDERIPKELLFRQEHEKGRGREGRWS